MKPEADATREVSPTSPSVDGTRQHDQAHQVVPTRTGTGAMAHPHASTLVDLQIHVRLKLAAL